MIAHTSMSTGHTPERPGSPSRGRRLVALCLGVIAVAACSQPAQPPDAPSLLHQASTAMASVHSLSADVKFGPGIVYQGLTLDSAQTQIARPSSSDTTIKVKQQDFLVDLRVVSVDGHVFVKAPFARFSEVTAQEAAEVPDLSLLFDSGRGLPALLRSGRSPTYRGSEKAGSVDCDKVSAVYSQEQVNAMLGGLQPAGTGEIDSTMWIGKGDHRLYRVLLRGPFASGGQSTTIDLRMHDYDAPVSIVRPTP